jgi:hypothetical protein
MIGRNTIDEREEERTDKEQIEKMENRRKKFQEMQGYTDEEITKKGGYKRWQLDGRGLLVV